MSDTAIVFILWGLQVVLFASLDTRRGVLNGLINTVAYIASSYFTFKWGGIIWLPVPMLVMPIIGGLVGGIVKGFYLRNKRLKDEQ